MINELNASLEAYELKWQKLISVRHERQFFASLMPTAVGWKVEDREEYATLCAELHDLSDHITETWMNGRWVAKFHLENIELANGVKIIKIMQRRPESEDAVGLDHVDFYVKDIKLAESVLASESDLKWSWEKNDITPGYHWISIWFDNTEAKLKNNTVLDTISVELADISKGIIVDA